MVHRGVRVFFHVLGGLALILLLAVAALTWRLSQGPLRLDAVTPYLRDAMTSPEDGLEIRLGGTLLYWESFDEMMDLRVTDVRAVDGAGAVVAAVPELAVTLSPRALLRGEIRLRSVEIIDPHLQLLRTEDGTLRLGLWSSETDRDPEAADADDMEGTAILRAMVAGLTGQNDLGVAADLVAVRVAGGQATLIDRQLDAVWIIPEAAVELYRGESGSVGVAASLDVALPGRAGETTHLDLVGDYDSTAQSVDLGVTFAGLRPASLAPVSSDLEPLAALDLPLDGTVTLTMGVTHTLELQSAGVSLTGGAGTLRLPDPVGLDYAVERLSLSGSVAANLDEIKLDGLRIALRPPPAADAAQETDDPEGEAPPPAILTAATRIAERPGAEAGFEGQLHLTAEAVPVDALAQWWPEGVAPNPRSWILANLSKGRLTEGQWDIGLAGPVVDRLEPTSVEGQAHVEGVTVRYMPEMPPVEAVDADLSFGMTRVDIAPRAGGVYGLRVTGGDIALTELDHPTTPRAAIDLRIDGPLTDALRLIDNPPLRYASRLGLDPGDARGAADTRLRMAFPLINDLRLDSLEILAEGEARDVTLTGAVFGRDLTQGNLSLTVDTETLEAKGQALVAGVPAGFAWREVFSGDPFRSRYAVRAMVAEDKRHVFGLDFPPFTPDFLQGPAHVDLEYTVFDDSLSTMGAQIDLADTRLRIPGVDYVKPPGQPAQATVALRLADGTVRDVSRFSVRSQDEFLAEGRVRLSDQGGLDTITLTTLEIGESAMEGTIAARADGGFDVDVRGHAFDATPFLKPGPAATGDDDGPDLPPVDLTAAFDVVWLSDAGTVEEVRASMRRRDGTIEQASVRGMLEGVAPLSLVLGRDPGQVGRQLTARAADAGAFLRAVGLLGTMRGGQMDLNARVLDGGRLEGVLRVDDYRLVDAPVLARLLSVAALTGILDALTGEGLAFSGLEAPFIYDDKVLTVKDFRTSGPSLGLTGEGTVDLGTDRLDLRGTVVPAYALNSLLGKLPLVGGLLSGFEAGGGLFAATYSVQGALDAPEVSVNPLSALAPGFLRNLFQSEAPTAEPEAPEQAPEGMTTP